MLIYLYRNGVILNIEVIAVLSPTEEPPDTERIKEAFRLQFKAEYAWFDFESGTEADPMNGPNPKIGPRAFHLNN